MNYLLLSPGIQFSLSRAILLPFPATDRVPLTWKCKGQVVQTATLCANSPSSTPEQRPCSSYSLLLLFPADERFYSKRNLTESSWNIRCFTQICEKAKPNFKCY